MTSNKLNSENFFIWQLKILKSLELILKFKFMYIFYLQKSMIGWSMLEIQS